MFILDVLPEQRREVPVLMVQVEDCAGLKCCNARPDPVIFYASEANIDIMNVAAQHGAVVNSVNHSRGTLTYSNAILQMGGLINPATNLPIGQIQLNGSAANAQNMANYVNTAARGQGVVMQSTHTSDPVGRLIGANDPTGGVSGSGLASHSMYGPNVSPQNKLDFWKSEQGSVSVLVPPSGGTH